MDQGSFGTAYSAVDEAGADSVSARLSKGVVVPVVWPSALFCKINSRHGRAGITIRKDIDMLRIDFRKPLGAKTMRLSGRRWQIGKDTAQACALARQDQRSAHSLHQP
jgi:hypothetical protein